MTQYRNIHRVEKRDPVSKNLNFIRNTNYTSHIIKKRYNNQYYVVSAQHRDWMIEILSVDISVWNCCSLNAHFRLLNAHFESLMNISDNVPNA
ncbi:4112_t:CDS:2 [Funneliformis caledonium]|uniref:4112_t:CDS:1 n=1 Tax=Funneliformis caledonium TaxID=1117310 RepID=A0A9N9GM56_9GLOM|nr:4112_t:CDS:2 [Funneliformis caledonium]